MRKLLDTLPWPMLLLAAAFLAIAPLGAQPHLVEKLIMLSQGQLVRPIDWFDLIMHSAPLLVIALKLFWPKKDTQSK